MGLFLLILDSTVVALAVPTVERDLHHSRDLFRVRPATGEPGIGEGLIADLSLSCLRPLNQPK